MVAERAGDAALLVEIPLAPALGILVKTEEAKTEFLANEDQVVIEFEALVVPRANDELGGGEGAAEIGKFAGEGDGAAGGAEAEEDGVGSAGHLGTLDVVKIDGHAGLRVVHRGGTGDTADAETEIVAGGIAAGGIVETVGGVFDLALDVGGIREHGLEIGRADVGEKFLRERRDHRRGVLEAGVEAAAGGGVGGLIADVFIGADLKRGEFDRGRRGGSECGSGGGCGRSAGFRRRGSGGFGGVDRGGGEEAEEVEKERKRDGETERRAHGSGKINEERVAG